MEENAFKKLISLKIKSLRNKENLTQQKFADILDVSQQSIQEIEQGKKGVGIFKLYKITKALKLKLSEFFKLIGL